MPPAPRLPIRDAVSAGGVVWRREPGGGVEVVICGRRADNVWGLPKGTPDNGESIEDAALREVREETGLAVRLGEPLGTISYWFTADGARHHKRVHHWLMEPTGGDVADHDAEFDEVVWLPLREAAERLSYRNEKRVLADAAALLGEGLA
jgi:8-oxo-dGTP pyrophosphatase MutT (NUDIX family)